MRPTELLDVLHETPRRLEATVRGLPRALLGWSPAPAKWSMLAILRHLRDVEGERYLPAYRRALAAAGAPGAVVARAAAVLDREPRASELLREWKRLRKEVLELLQRCDTADWTREVEVPEAGTLSLAALLSRHAEHDSHHLKQIEAIQDRYAILARLESAPRELRALVEGLPREALRRPGSGGGSMLEEIAALCHFENRMLERYSAILETDHPPLLPLEAEPPDPQWLVHAADPLDALRELERLRTLTRELLHAMGPRLWQRRGVHPRRGELSIADLVTQHLERDATTLARLRTLRAAMAGAPAAAHLASQAGNASPPR